MASQALSQEQVWSEFFRTDVRIEAATPNYAINQPRRDNTVLLPELFPEPSKPTPNASKPQQQSSAVPVDGKVYNPLTGRMVQIGGQVFNSLVGRFYDTQGRQLPQYATEMAKLASAAPATTSEIKKYTPIDQDVINAIIQAGSNGKFTKIDRWDAEFTEGVKKSMDATCGSRCHLAKKADGQTVFHTCHPQTFAEDGCRPDCGVLHDSVKHAQFQSKNGGLIVRDAGNILYGSLGCPAVRSAWSQ